MKYIPKQTYLKDKFKISLILIFVFSFCVHAAAPSYTLMFVITVLVVFTFTQKFYFPAKWDDAIKELLTKAAHEDVTHFSDLASRHLPVLARKRKFLIVKDDYGYVIRDKWESEKTSFLGKFNYLPLSTEYYLGLDIDGQSSLLEALINDFAEDNNISVAYSEEMRPSEYEHYCAELLNDSGWQAKTTVATGDQGVDVLAERPGLKVAIQCKKYSNPVGNKAVQEVAAGKNYWDADISVVVTNATYTPSARILATSLGVFLLHHDQLPDLLEIIEGVLEVES